MESKDPENASINDAASGSSHLEKHGMDFEPSAQNDRGLKAGSLSKNHEKRNHAVIVHQTLPLS